jgi:hypothetical protein
VTLRLIGVIYSHCGGKLGGRVYHSYGPLVVQLIEDGPHSCLGCVGLQVIPPPWFGVAQDRGSFEQALGGFEGALFGVRPFPGSLLGEQGGQG